MNTLPVFEMFYSLQGEGHNVGTAAYFIRLAGCNVKCSFCDEQRAWLTNNATDTSIQDIISSVKTSGAKNVVVTGGEPTMYNLSELTSLLHKMNIKTFLETSGVNQITGAWDWITLSPKQNLLPKESSFAKANELKVVITRQEDFKFAQDMKKLSALHSNHTEYYLQPEYSQKHVAIPIIIDYIKKNPKWKLSLQTHKMIDIK